MSVDFILNGPPVSLASLGKQLFGKKMRVTPETSKLVQEAVFAAGGSWLLGEVEVKNIEMPYLHVSEGGRLTFADHKEESCFKLHPNTEVEITPVTTFTIKEVDKEKEEELKRIKELEKEVASMTEELNQLKEEVGRG